MKLATGSALKALLFAITVSFMGVSGYGCAGGDKEQGAGGDELSAEGEGGEHAEGEKKDKKGKKGKKAKGKKKKK